MTTPSQKVTSKPTPNNKRTVNPYKNHKHDGGDSLGKIDCLLCEKEMLWNLKPKTPTNRSEV